ncbi:MAG: alpha/beta hydrolase [bacterium]|nr:alpha/beta hydrolase [bacterium]
MDGLLDRPEGACALYVLAHGAGAGMRHPFLARTAELLAERNVATFRYEFPYMSEGRKRPDPPGVATRAVRDAVEDASKKTDLPLVAGGKSFGGRMTSTAQSHEPLPGVRGLVFLGFPLHAPGRVGDNRAEHLYSIEIPMLFIQGTRDALADLDLMRGVCKQLGSLATLYIVEGGDHSFKVLKRFGRKESEVMSEIADTVASWTEGLL